MPQASVVLATAGYDHTVRFWEAASGRCYKTLQYAESVRAGCTEQGMVQSSELCLLFCVLCTVYRVLCTVYCLLCTVFCVLRTWCTLRSIGRIGRVLARVFAAGV